LLCIDRRTGIEGRSFKTSKGVESLLAVVDDTVHVDSLSNHVYALELGDDSYRAAISNSIDDWATVISLTTDGAIRPDNWSWLQLAAIELIDGILIIPKFVYDREPANFRLSVQIHPEEPRIRGDK